LMEPWVHLENQEELENLGHQDFLEHLEQRETWVLLDLKEVLAFKDQEGKLENLEDQEKQERWDHLEKMEVMETKEAVVHQGLQDLLAFQAPEENLD